MKGGTFTALPEAYKSSEPALGGSLRTFCKNCCNSGAVAPPKLSSWNTRSEGNRGGLASRPGWRELHERAQPFPLPSTLRNGSSWSKSKPGKPKLDGLSGGPAFPAPAGRAVHGERGGGGAFGVPSPPFRSPNLLGHARLRAPFPGAADL